MNMKEVEVAMHMNNMKKSNIKELLNQSFSDVYEKDIQRFVELWLLLPASTYIVVMHQQNFGPKIYNLIWLFAPTFVILLFRCLLDKRNNWKFIMKLYLYFIGFFLLVIMVVYLSYKLGLPIAEKWMERMIMFFTT